MKRRDFLKSTAALGGSLAAISPATAASETMGRRGDVLGDAWVELVLSSFDLEGLSICECVGDFPVG